MDFPSCRIETVAGVCGTFSSHTGRLFASASQGSCGS